MMRHPETKFCTKSYPYKMFKEVCKKVPLAKKLNTGRRFLKEILASYEQKKKSNAMQLMKQPISPLH